MTDEELIAQAIAAGKLRRIPMWATSDWEDLAYRERRKRMKETAKRLRKSAMRVHFDGHRSHERIDKQNPL